MPATAYSLNVQPLSRSKGKSAVAKVAYITGDKFRDERTDKLHDYSRKRGVETVLHAQLKDAPAWSRDVETAWNAVEANENRKNSTTAKVIDGLAFPHQLSADERRGLLTDFVREQFNRKGLLWTAAIHEPDRHGDERNYHAHLIWSERRITADGFAPNKEFAAVNRAAAKEQLAAMRERWATMTAKQLERKGLTLEAARWKHGHLTLPAQEQLARARGDIEFAERIANREPTKHLGRIATALERQGIETERGNAQLTVEAGNAERQEITQQRAAVQRDITGLEARAEVLATPAQRQAAQEHDYSHLQNTHSLLRQREERAAAQAAAREQQRAEKRATFIAERQEQHRQARAGKLADLDDVKKLREAWNWRESNGAFVATIEAQGFTVARVSERDALLLRHRAEVAKSHSADYFVPTFNAGELVAFNPRGASYRLDGATLDDAQAQKILAAYQAKHPTLGDLQRASEQARDSERAERATAQAPAPSRAAIMLQNADRAAHFSAKGLESAARGIERIVSGLADFLFGSSKAVSPQLDQDLTPMAKDKGSLARQAREDSMASDKSLGSAQALTIKHAGRELHFDPEVQNALRYEYERQQREKDRDRDR